LLKGLTTAAAPTIKTQLVPANAIQQTNNKIDTFELSIDTAQIANRILTRPLQIKDLDFTDLTILDDLEISRAGIAPPPPMHGFNGMVGGPPPPPPPPIGGIGAPPPPPPPPMAGFGGPPPPPPMFKMSQSTNSLAGSVMNLSSKYDMDDHDKRKLIKLHWREAHVPFTLAAPTPSLNKYGSVVPVKSGQEESIWTNLTHVEIDKDKLAHLFELKQAEVKTKVNHKFQGLSFYIHYINSWSIIEISSEIVI